MRRREALAAFVLPVLIVWKWFDTGGDIAWGMRSAALALFVFLLVQGTLYWHLKLRSVEGQAPLPSYFHALFSGFRLSNLIGIGALLVALLSLERSAVSNADIAWCAALLAGAVLEQVNYYHVQLMVDTRAALDYVRRNRRLRKAALAVDLSRSRPKAAHTTPV